MDDKRQGSSKPTVLRRRIASLLRGVLIGFILVAVVVFLKHKDPTVVYDAPTSTLPDIGGHWELINHEGQLASSTNFGNKYLLVYFGYTFCPDICPTGLFNISEAFKILGKTSARIQPVFITIDPERDQPERLREYIKSFQIPFVAFTGSVDQVQQVIKLFKVYAQKVKPENTQSDYLVDHSSLVYLLSPEGRLLAHFPHSMAPHQMAKGIRQALAAAKKDERRS